MSNAVTQSLKLTILCLIKHIDSPIFRYKRKSSLNNYILVQELANH